MRAGTPMSSDLWSLNADAFAREGKVLFLAKGAQLPPFCIKCGQTATTSLKKKFYWHPTWMFVFILVGIIVYIIVALIARTRMDVQLPLCDRHSVRYRRMRTVAATLMIVGPLLLLAAFSLPAEYTGVSAVSALAGVSLLLAGMILWLVAGQILRATFIGVQGGRFRGASEQFLDHLPSRPPASPAPSI
jgi:hypothetical protein